MLVLFLLHILDPFIHLFLHIPQSLYLVILFVNFLPHIFDQFQQSSLPLRQVMIFNIHILSHLVICILFFVWSCLKIIFIIKMLLDK